MSTTSPYLNGDGAVTNVPSYGKDLDRTPSMRKILAYNMAWELGLPILTCIQVGEGRISCIYIFSLVCVERLRDDDGRCHL